MTCFEKRIHKKTRQIVTKFYISVSTKLEAAATSAKSQSRKTLAPKAVNKNNRWTNGRRQLSVTKTITRLTEPKRQK